MSPAPKWDSGRAGTRHTPLRPPAVPCDPPERLPTGTEGSADLAHTEPAAAPLAWGARGGLTATSRRGPVTGAGHTAPGHRLCQMPRKSGHLPSGPQGEAGAGGSGPQDGRQFVPDTGECFRGYFYLENILLQQVRTGGRQGVLGPEPLGAAEDRGPWALSPRVAIIDTAPSPVSYPRGTQNLEGLRGFTGPQLCSRPLCDLGQVSTLSGPPSCRQSLLRACHRQSPRTPGESQPSHGAGGLPGGSSRRNPGGSTQESH